MVRNLSCVMLVCVARIAVAGPPSGYQCSPGTAKKGIGCSCPKGYVDKRDADNAAICADAPKVDPSALLKLECSKLAPGAIRAYTSELAGDEIEKFRISFDDPVAKLCVADKWSAEERRCFLAASSTSAALECLDKFAPAHRTALDKKAADAMPFSATLVGSEIRLKGQIRFDGHGNNIALGSIPLLKAVAKVINANPGLRFEIQGHTDNSSVKDEAMRLTQGRAEAVRTYLVNARISGDRLVAKGYGSDKPLVPNITVDNRAKNNRIQLIVVRDAVVGAHEGTPIPPTTPDDKQSGNSRVVVTSGRIEIREVVYFETSNAQIKLVSFPLLDEVARVLKDNANLKIEVRGHTDSVGAAAANRKLSQQRADAVRVYLVQHGIDSERLTAKGYGADMPIAENQTEAGRAQNRRIEFVIR